jgi:hypothetical protein
VSASDDKGAGLPGTGNMEDRVFPWEMSMAMSPMHAGADVLIMYHHLTQKGEKVLCRPYEKLGAPLLFLEKDYPKF